MLPPGCYLVGDDHFPFRYPSHTKYHQKVSYACFSSKICHASDVNYINFKMCCFCIFWTAQLANYSGGIKGGHFRQIFGFLTPQNRILPPRCHPQNFWCRHWVIISTTVTMNYSFIRHGIFILLYIPQYRSSTPNGQSTYPSQT